MAENEDFGQPATQRRVGCGKIVPWHRLPPLSELRNTKERADLF